MENPFFTALESPGFQATALATQTNNVLMPFIHYLENSINALREKEVSCHWQSVSKIRYQLKPDRRIWFLSPESEININADQDGWFEIISVDGKEPDAEFEPDETIPLSLGKGKSYREFSIAKEEIRLSPDYKLYLPELEYNGDEIHWCGYKLEIRPLAMSLDNLAFVYIDGQKCQVKSQNGNVLVLSGYVRENSRLSIHGQDISFSLTKSINEQVLANWQGQRDGNGWLLFSKDKPQLMGQSVIDVTHKRLVELSCEHFHTYNSPISSDKWTLSPSDNKNEGGLLFLQSLLDEQLDSAKFICQPYPAINWSIQSKPVDEKWIQLIEKDDGNDTGKSVLDYFFTDDQNITILDDRQRKNDDGYRVLKAKPEEKQLLLAQNSRGKKSWSSVYPAQEGKREIRVSVDISQLARQRDAIKDLMSRPSASHWPLIQLLQQRELTAWPTVIPVPDHTLAWQVLTDPNFDGCDRQREFVTKALASQDFTILDGPPGTGKTTTILELIMQLVMQGKRVLLSASTHAAINNVLERIKENTKLNQHIFPLRIGDESNAIGVEEYQFDNVFNELSSATSVSKQLMVDASNLVCGTTIGILKLFREPGLNLHSGEPPFDVMIIDECSKTTFQEFIVPARFAKRWVLVGDVRQLSPFTDRDQIVANLDKLMLTAPKGKQAVEYLSPELQEACFLLEELRGSKQQPYTLPMAVPVTPKLAIALQAEIQARQKHHHLAKGLSNILIIQASNTHSGYAKRLADVLHNPQCLYEYSLCFIEEICLRQLSQFIPSDMTILHPAWQRTAQASRHHIHVGAPKTVFEFWVNKQNYTDTNQLHAKLLERLSTSKWSEEICWRLEREYWLRLSKQQNKKTAYIEEPLERLFPKSVYTDGRIHILKDIAFPSILEALSGDGLVKRKKDVPTTLNQGFNSNEKGQRHTTLTFQHRMHPDISAFPRKQFYPEGVLTDGSKTVVDREWSYQYYPRRSIWQHVPGTTQKGNSNKDEVLRLIAELKRFCDWAEGKTKNKKGEHFEVAVLTFYKGQEKALREALQKLPNTNAPNTNRHARFVYKTVSIKLATVDYFQGQEADVVFLSMVNTNRDGFMDSPNRLNVAVTRARYQMVIIGDHGYFSASKTIELNNLAKTSPLLKQKDAGQLPEKQSSKRN